MKNRIFLTSRIDNCSIICADVNTGRLCRCALRQILPAISDAVKSKGDAGLLCGSTPEPGRSRGCPDNGPSRSESICSEPAAELLEELRLLPPPSLGKLLRNDPSVRFFVCAGPTLTSGDKHAGLLKASRRKSSRFGVWPHIVRWALSA